LATSSATGSTSPPEYVGVASGHKLLAVEFYHAGFDHYFVAATASDISDLDNGVRPGWAYRAVRSLG
jgi:hypothetical protein